MTIPLATGLHNVTFAPDSYWRGETHRLSDRAGSLRRLLQELAALNVEQIISSRQPLMPPVLTPGVSTARRPRSSRRISALLRKPRRFATHSTVGEWMNRACS